MSNPLPRRKFRSQWIEIYPWLQPTLNKSGNCGCRICPDSRLRPHRADLRRHGLSKGHREAAERFSKRQAAASQQAVSVQEEEEPVAEKAEEQNSQEDGESTTESGTDSEDDDEEADRTPRSIRMLARKKVRPALRRKRAADEASNRIEESQRQKRRKKTLKISGKAIHKERSGSDDDDYSDSNQPKLTDVITDDEETEEEAEFEAWKVREMKRIKQYEDGKEAFERDQSEIRKLRSMADEERNVDRRMKPNNKSTMPRDTKVKNFGKRGKRNRTHLVDQDTSENTLVGQLNLITI